MALPAGRLMLERLRTLANSEADFAFETTLAARSFVPFMQSCKDRGYTIGLLYFWLRSPNLAVERVARRVASGGHSIPEDVIRRRYERGRRNLMNLYLPLCARLRRYRKGRWIVYDNSEDSPAVVAQRGEDGQPLIVSTEVWNQINEGQNG